MKRVGVNSEMLIWAIQRAGLDINTFTQKEPNLNLQDWIDGKSLPTVKQLEKFSQKVNVPFGYLFFPKPPQETIPFPFFRTGEKSPTHQVSLAVYETILELQNRQDWLRDYLKDNGAEKLPFVGKFKDRSDANEIACDIRSTLDFQENWASTLTTRQDALHYLGEAIENIGIIVVFSGYVKSNTHRKIPLEECRGFVLNDDFAPFLFVNNADFDAAKIFTLAHELAHIWIGRNAGFDLRHLQPADNAIEKLCDQVAAEVLVPQKTFEKLWQEYDDAKIVAKKFKVSEIVIARRALDLGKWSKAEFLNFYADYKKRWKEKESTKKSGGDYYATARKRISPRFAKHIREAVQSGRLLYRDAYKLTNIKGDHLEKLFTHKL
ncbi:protein of unknown function DUF955 [Chloroherpeton thalassium ATCC 35110]|uniref:IrrE N-terminal-like domain-containing protein n=1 Tax=Chloroherpeton thalassium (strain ATCC 35110 / GB-78) TaxID=517418 RepID=B3QS84_CHLT3|nr:ImmA/IrrE family metallo-endopeptidase [Chloroherpeton thalassium]ACF14029.1 protein of unknown function DUF955 [Chloroherpeton thalassium ATCC 35110]